MREQITETKMHALDYWQVIRNRWGVILLTFFLITLASLVIIALLDKKFAGRTKFQVNISSAPDVFNIVQGDARETHGGNWLETQFKTITARETLLVGLSRARDQLVICGDPDEIRRVGGKELLKKLRRG